MPEIFVLQSRLEREAEGWEACRKEIAGIKGRLSGIRSGMRGKVRSKNGIGQQLVDACGRLDALLREVRRLEQALEAIAGCYMAAEQKLENSGRDLSASIWNGNRLNGQAVSALSPLYGGGQHSSQQAHRIVEEQGPVREEWAGVAWSREGDVSGTPAGVYVKGSLWGGEWEEEDVKTLGEGQAFEWKGTQTGWLARGDTMGFLGERSFAGSAALLSWEESLEAGLTWDLQRPEKQLPKLEVEAAVSVKGAEIHGEEKRKNYFSELGGSLGYAKAEASLRAGIDETERLGIKQQVTLEAAALKGEAKGGFELWGIYCAIGLQGSLGAAGIHSGYELTAKSVHMNMGTALGAGVGIDLEADWSDARLPGTKSEVLERKKRRLKKQKGKCR